MSDNELKQVMAVLQRVKAHYKALGLGPFDFQLGWTTTDDEKHYVLCITLGKDKGVTVPRWVYGSGVRLLIEEHRLDRAILF